MSVRARLADMIINEEQRGNRANVENLKKLEADFEYYTKRLYTINEDAKEVCEMLDRLTIGIMKLSGDDTTSARVMPAQQVMVFKSGGHLH